MVMMRHKDTGLIKKGFYGFSWTTLFFGVLPALFRRDFVTLLGGFAVMFILGILTVGVGSVVAMMVWAFFYNKYYTRKLVEDGYLFDDSENVVTEARLRLGVAPAHGL
jgi:hypothetical protein